MDDAESFDDAGEAHIAVAEADSSGGDFTLSDPPGESDDEAIARLAKLPPMEYERCRVSEAERRGLRVPILDKLVQQARGAAEPTHGRFVALHDPEPWPEPLSTADLLDSLAAAVRRHVMLSQHAIDAVALWIAHTWVADRFDHSPRLGITSPTRRCGKSTLMEVLRATCRRDTGRVFVARRNGGAARDLPAD